MAELPLPGLHRALHKGLHTFVETVVEWIEGAHESSIEVARRTIEKMNNAIIVATPVDTSFLRASYYAAINTTPSGTAGAGTTAVNAVAAQLKEGDVYTMGNVAAYARRLEYGFVGQDSLGRNYNQRGRFWIASVIALAPAFIAASIEEIANENDV